MRRLATCAALACLVASCSSKAGSVLPPGRYSGSTADDRAVSIEITDKVRVNNRKATLLEPDTNNSFRVNGLAGRPVFKCSYTPKAEELRCTMTIARHDETIELMKE